MGFSVDQSLSTCCAELRHQLVALNAPNTYNVIRNYGLLSALESQQNLAGRDAGLQSQLEAQWGKATINDTGASCKFKLWVDGPVCATATEGTKSLCNNENTSGPVDYRTQLDVKIEKGFYKEGKLEPSDVACLCSGTLTERLNKEITQAAQMILKSVEESLVGDVFTAMGDYTNGVDSKVSPATINLLSATASGLYAQPVGWTVPLLEYHKMQTQGGILAVGGDLIYAYNSALNLSPTSAPGGYSLPNGVTTFYDPNVQSQLVDETFSAPLLTWAPGALWIMRYLDNVNPEQNKVLTSDVSYTVVNLFGQLFDLSIVRDGSCNIMRWVLSYQYDLWALPTDVWNICTPTTQRQAYDIGCSVMDCDDITLPAGIQ